MTKKGEKKGKKTSKEKGKGTKSSSKPAPATPATDIPLVQDERFSAQHWDPRFGRVPARASSASAAPDERFEAALARPGFQSSAAPVDRFGRVKRRGRVSAAAAKGGSDSEDGANASLSPDSDSDSSDSSDSEAEARPADEVADAAVSAIPRGSATHRLAVIGLDWSTTRAVDIFASLSSFCPADGALTSVAVHPSKLGLRRIAAEARLGPAVVSKVDQEMLSRARARGVAVAAADDDDAPEDAGGSDSDSDAGRPQGPMDRERAQWAAQSALRKYEAERLQYFYAVAEFDSRAAADAVYDQCDGVEYTQSRRAFDLRFIPDEMVIETAPRETATGVPDGYHPPNVAPSTLSNSTVKLSWDADAPERVVLKRRVMGRHEIDEDNLKAYLASASEDEKADEEEIARKRRILLGGDTGDAGGGGVPREEDNEDAPMELEVKFEPGMLEKGEEIMRQRQERLDRSKETPWQARLRRMNENRAEKRRKHKEKMMEGSDALVGNTDAGSNEPASFDNDPFFTSEGGAGSFKKAQRAAAKKRRRAAVAEEDPQSDAAKKQRTHELELLLADDAGGKDKGSLREALAQAESDDDEDRKQRRKEKRTRGRRRADKERMKEAKIAKPSALDTKDERFQGLFDSHLFAMDPTHPKFKKNETTERILQEKSKRFKEGGNVSVAKDTQTVVAKVNNPDQVRGANVLELAERIKAKAKARKVK